MKVVIAGSYQQFMEWYWSSGLERDQCYYLAPYADICNNIPMIEGKDDLVYVGSYKENLEWPKIRANVLLPMVKKWQQYWKERDSE